MPLAPRVLEITDELLRRIVSRETIDGTLVGQARTHDGLALLLAPPARIGPSRLVIMDGASKQRSIPLAEVTAGLETIDAHRAVSRVDLPALAVDPTGARALVVPAARPVAEIDLVMGQVVYRDAREAVSLLGRLRRLEPAAEAKSREGSERQAAWVGEHLVAVSGQDAHRLASSQDEQTTPAGLTLIDVRRWTNRTLDEQASQFSFSAGVLLAYGTTWKFARWGSRPAFGT